MRKPYPFERSSSRDSSYNSGLTPADRAAKIAAQDILDLQDTIWRREEYLCARVK